MNRKVLFWSITVALGGFLFGFDTAVISGAEQAIQKLWELDSWTHGLAISIALYGTVLGALFGGKIADRFGRKRTLFWIGILYLISAIGSAIATDVNLFMIFRFLGGLGVGASSVVAPMYISEISPANLRGRLVALFQFNIVFGILIAYFSNYLLLDAGWRWMVGVEALPALAFSVLVLGVPKSPRWLLVNQEKEAEAREVLSIIQEAGSNQELTIDEQVALIKRSAQESAGKLSLGQFFSKTFSFPILLAFLLAFFNQLSGINAVIYYAPRIFDIAGLGTQTAFLSTIGIGVINLLFTMLGIAMIDRYGRRHLMFIGSIGYIVSLTILGIVFLQDQTGGAIVPILLFLFIASHAIGQGAVIWVFIAEIFPNHARGYGMSLGSATHWVFAALITNVFPFFATTFGPGRIFIFFAGMMVFQLLFVWKIMPETKGKSLEELEETLSPTKKAVLVRRDGMTAKENLLSILIIC